MRRFGVVIVLLALAGCGSTKTITVTRVAPPRAMGLSRVDTVPTEQNYKPKFGNAEHAVFRSNGCGVERWAVKTLTDPGAAQVTLTPQPTTIADLVSIAPPVEPTDRVNPTEDTTFELSGQLVFIKAEADGDYHLVVEDQQSNTMIVESPNPSCAVGSRVLAQIESVRHALDARFPAVGQGQVLKPNVLVTVTGVGFADRLHGQTGVAPNGLELHPMLSIQFAGPTAARIHVPDLYLKDNRKAD